CHLLFTGSSWDARFSIGRPASPASLRIYVIGNMSQLWLVGRVRFGMIWVFLQSESPAPVLLATLSLPQS
ncbi:MAG TPA: hypothetical protein VFP96_15615, partial [Candidatus Acidoferrum sp.]|nr:hypothetical protein [Candidatus Acidoferrum sp.]